MASTSAETRRIDAAIIADETDRGALRAGHRAGLVAHLLGDRHDFLDFVPRRPVTHHNQHD